MTQGDTAASQHDKGQRVDLSCCRQAGSCFLLLRGSDLQLIHDLFHSRGRFRQFHRPSALGQVADIASQFDGAADRACLDHRIGEALVPAQAGRNPGIDGDFIPACPKVTWANELPGE